MALLFKNVRGYYLKYKGQDIDPEVRHWNIKVLNLERNTRHKD